MAFQLHIVALSDTRTKEIVTADMEVSSKNLAWVVVGFGALVGIFEFDSYLLSFPLLAVPYPAVYWLSGIEPAG